MCRIPHTHVEPARSRARLVIALVGASLLAGACGEKAAPPPPPPPEVLVTSVVRRDVPVPMELVGQTRGFQDVEIRARVEGFLDVVGFNEGTLVRKGEVLYRIDRKPFEASQANARAELGTAQARYEKTQNDVRRLKPLAAKQAVSAQELDNAVAAEEAARSQVEARKAELDRVSLDLGYTNVTSPIDGLVGTTQVKAGSLVGRGESTLLTTVSQIDPILFRAGISEAEYLRLARRAEEIRKNNTGKIPIDLILADGSTHSAKGQLDAIERAIDPTTGTLSLQFRFPNPGGILRPGQYGRIHFVTESKKDAILVPQRAVQEMQNLYSVAVVGGDNKVAFKNIKVGQRLEDLWVVESGLTGNERVVVAGLQRLREGTVVNPKPAPATPAAASAAASSPAPTATAAGAR